MVPEATLNGQTWMDLVKETTDIAAQLAPEAIAKNIDLELITPDTPPKIKGNSTAALPSGFSFTTWSTMPFDTHPKKAK